jgi:hypothetical protein
VHCTLAADSLAYGLRPHMMMCADSRGGGSNCHEVAAVITQHRFQSCKATTAMIVCWLLQSQHCSALPMGEVNLQVSAMACLHDQPAQVAAALVPTAFCSTTPWQLAQRTTGLTSVSDRCLCCVAGCCTTSCAPLVLNALLQYHLTVTDGSRIWSGRH